MTLDNRLAHFLPVCLNNSSSKEIKTDSLKSRSFQKKGFPANWYEKHAMLKICNKSNATLFKVDSTGSKELTSNKEQSIFDSKWYYIKQSNTGL